MAACALDIGLRALLRNQTCWTFQVNRMAGRAAHLVLRMAALDASYMTRLIQVTLKASPVRLGRRELCRIPDIFRRYRFRMLASRSMARLAGLALEAALLISLDGKMRALLVSLEDVLVTCLAGFRANIGCSGGWLWSWLKSNRERSRGECKQRARRNCSEPI